jgi:hypothetical protein
MALFGLYSSGLWDCQQLFRKLSRIGGYVPRFHLRCCLERTSWRGLPVSAGDEFALPATGVDLEKLSRSLFVLALRRSTGNQTRPARFSAWNRDRIRYALKRWS